MRLSTEDGFIFSSCTLKPQARDGNSRPADEGQVKYNHLRGFGPQILASLQMGSILRTSPRTVLCYAAKLCEKQITIKEKFPHRAWKVVLANKGKEQEEVPENFGRPLWSLFMRNPNLVPNKWFKVLENPSPTPSISACMAQLFTGQSFSPAPRMLSYRLTMQRYTHTHTIQTNRNGHGCYAKNRHSELMEWNGRNSPQQSPAVKVGRADPQAGATGGRKLQHALSSSIPAPFPVLEKRAS